MYITIKPKLTLVWEECLPNNVGNNLDKNFSSLKKYILDVVKKNWNSRILEKSRPGGLIKILEGKQIF